MPEQNQISYSFKELAELLIKDSDIHDGLWGIYMEFGLGAGNIQISPSGDVSPSAFVPVVKIGIQKFKEENNLTVDAAKVNPPKK